MKIKKAVAAAFTAFALTGLVACSSDADSGDSSKTSAEAAGDDKAADAGSDADVDAGDVATGGSTEVKVEGQDIEGLDLDSVTCVKQGGKVNIASGSTGGQQGLAIVLTDENPPKVEAFSMLVDGVALAVASQAGAQVGSAEATVDDDKYTITGTAEGMDTANPTGDMVSKEFEIKVSCS